MIDTKQVKTFLGFVCQVEDWIMLIAQQCKRTAAATTFQRIRWVLISWSYPWEPVARCSAWQIAWHLAQYTREGQRSRIIFIMIIYIGYVIFRDYDWTPVLGEIWYSFVVRIRPRVSTDRQHADGRSEPNPACWGDVCAGADSSLASLSPTPTETATWQKKKAKQTENSARMNSFHWGQ